MRSECCLDTGSDPYPGEPPFPPVTRSSRPAHTNAGGIPARGNPGRKRWCSSSEPAASAPMVLHELLGDLVPSEAGHRAAPEDAGTEPSGLELRRMSQPATALVIDFSSASMRLTDVAAVLAALNLLVEASLWIQICDRDAHESDVMRARERLRNAVFKASHRDSDARLLRDALFGDPSVEAEHDRFRNHVSTWDLSRGVQYGAWLQRELDAYDDDLYRRLTDFAQVDRLEQRSPIHLRVGIAGLATAGAVVAGPLGMAPAALLGLYETVLWVRERWWRSKEGVAASQARIARSDTAILREHLAQAVYRTAAQAQLPDSAVEVAVRVALPAAIDLGSSPAIERIAVESMTIDDIDPGRDPS